MLCFAMVYVVKDKFNATVQTMWPLWFHRVACDNIFLDLNRMDQRILHPIGAGTYWEYETNQRCNNMVDFIRLL